MYVQVYIQAYTHTRANIHMHFAQNYTLEYFINNCHEQQAQRGKGTKDVMSKGMKSNIEAETGYGTSIVPSSPG